MITSENLHNIKIMQNYQVTFINLSMNLYINNVLFKKVNKIKSSQEYILYKNKHSYFNFSKNKDILIIDDKNSIIFKYRNMPFLKYINYKHFDEKTSVIVLPLNTSLNLKIGDVLVFESEHII